MALVSERRSRDNARWLPRLLGRDGTDLVYMTVRVVASHLAAGLRAEQDVKEIQAMGDDDLRRRRPRAGVSHRLSPGATPPWDVDVGTPRRRSFRGDRQRRFEICGWI